VNFNLRVYTITAGLPVTFEDVDVVFRQGQRILYAKTFGSSENNDVNMEYAFDLGGDYRMEVEFRGGAARGLKSSFPIVVERGVDSPQGSDFSGQSVMAFVAGILAATLFRQVRPRVSRGLIKRTMHI
jgi:hypothetical protein